MKRRSDQSQNEPVVEVTLQSIRGIVFRDGSPTNDHDDIDNDSLLLDMPNLTAAVAFTGSASEMEVASSFVCPHTGNLMVESLPAIYNNNNNNNNNDNDNSSSYTASPSRSTRMITQNGTTDNRSPSLTQSSSSSNNTNHSKHTCHVLTDRKLIHSGTRRSRCVVIACRRRLGGFCREQGVARKRECEKYQGIHVLSVCGTRAADMIRPNHNLPSWIEPPALSRSAPIMV